MKQEPILEKGKDYLSRIDDQYQHQKELLEQYQLNPNFKDDSYAWLTCVLALKAINEGNFGVGALLVNGKGDIIIENYNQVFYPRFASNQHAEMVVMNELEQKYPDLANLEEYILYTSLESCPMCLTRLASSGIKKILHIASDPPGGMVNQMDNLPHIWKELANSKIFQQADCSQQLVNYASQVFQIKIEQKFEKLAQKGGSTLRDLS